MAEDVRDWLVTYRGRARDHVIVWAVLEGVPAGVDPSDALEGWSRWPAWQARVRPGGTVTVRRRTARDRLPAVHEVIGWDVIRPRNRRLSVDLPGELHAAAVRTARLAECSLSDLVRDALLGVCMARGVDVAAPVVEALELQSLPGMGCGTCQGCVNDDGCYAE